MLRHPIRPGISGYFLLLLAGLGFRRWLAHPWQLTFCHYMVGIACCASGLVLLSCPRPMAAFLVVVTFALFASLRLQQFGYRLVDILTLLAILLMTIAVLLPEMVATHDRTAGKRYFPFAVPQRYIELLYGWD